ncbi:unnamed protein product [Mycena citricolor]|uniref:tyrosinase n=1 Tax=Mycena citricolor TaxID=2018698 RepID=A0AAD2H4D2_9AGAR|nr:unnamed protein product [Mycena citricolor]
MSSHFVITGARGGNTQGADAPNRLEINELIKSEEQFSLYIQALASMFSDNQAGVTSFFQIAGIHGLPYVQWNESGSTESPPPDLQWGGYCTHGSTLFPTWHRPYVALFEQVLNSKAVEIAKGYKADSERWSQAAANLRAPYWDWAVNAVLPHQVIQDRQVTITLPDGTRGAVPNPLFAYTFHPIDASFPEPYSQWDSTLRHPTREGKTNVRALIQQLQSSAEDIRSSTYRLLTRVHTWPAFSNHSADDGGSASNSLEAIHDGIHNDVGGGGQMGDPSVAGFDPVFFLHHANVDRMLSLWSALNPGVWVSRGPAEGGTWTIPPNAIIGPSTDLTPFWETQNTYWLSTQTTKTSTLGYSYPEFNGLDLTKPAAVKTAISRAVNRLYGGATFFQMATAANGAKSTDATNVASAAPVQAKAAPSPKPHTPTIRAALHTQTETTAPLVAAHPAPSLSTPTMLDWSVRIHVQKYALPSTFCVLIFLGPVPSSPLEWRASPSYVGSHTAFVNTSSARCANCTAQAHADGGFVIEGFVHLNEALARVLSQASFEPEAVVPFLAQELSWRVQLSRGAEEVPLDDARLDSLEVKVGANSMTVLPGADLPTCGETRWFPEITHGKRGGASA